MNTEHFVVYKEFHFRFLKFGNGNHHLLAFHGYDRSAEDFLVFEKSLGDEFTIYAFDIFYHGKSFIDESKIKPELSKFELSEIIQKFMHENQINKISLLAYSLGGRLAACILEQMPGQVENCFLLAADGFQIHLWNSFITRSKFGQWLFKGIINDPKPFIKLASLSVKLKMLSKKSFHFVEGYLQNDEHRKRLLQVWLLFKECNPDKERIRKCIYRYQINFRFFCGKYDEIIPPKVGIDFCKGIKKKSCYVELECGHKLMHEFEKISEVILKSIQE